MNRYDGYRFKHYTTVELGAYNNDVEWVAEDGAGVLWLKTPVNYCYYNRETDEFVNTIHLPLKEIGIDAPIHKLFIDEDKNIWCSTQDTLSHYHFGKKQLNNYPIAQGAEVIYRSEERRVVIEGRPCEHAGCALWRGQLCTSHHL